jgi:hypothetical protein
MPLKKPPEKALAKCQCAYLPVFFQQAAFGREGFETRAIL